MVNGPYYHHWLETGIRFTRDEMEWIVKEFWERHQWLLDSYTVSEGGRWCDNKAWPGTLPENEEFIHALRFVTPQNGIIEWDEINGIRPWYQNALEVWTRGFNEYDTRKTMKAIDDSVY